MGDVLGFCANCGTPVCYERERSPEMINVPRALFESGTGRDPLATSSSMTRLSALPQR
ncbi:GFA family protein [Reyranella massiliensis]|uniref:GFA family protein n=1 Tax=Reyranella massiliensis TaxID=445220 RepID=UPI001C07487A|nr:GFA family protein [Reyranella massiliensis]